MIQKKMFLYQLVVASLFELSNTFTTYVYTPIYVNCRTYVLLGPKTMLEPWRVRCLEKLQATNLCAKLNISLLGGGRSVIFNLIHAIIPPQSAIL